MLLFETYRVLKKRFLRRCAINPKHVIIGSDSDQIYKLPYFWPWPILQEKLEFWMNRDNFPLKQDQKSTGCDISKPDKPNTAKPDTE